MEVLFISYGEHILWKLIILLILFMGKLTISIDWAMASSSQTVTVTTTGGHLKSQHESGLLQRMISMIGESLESLGDGTPGAALKIMVHRSQDNETHNSTCS